MVDAARQERREPAMTETDAARESRWEARRREQLAASDRMRKCGSCGQTVRRGAACQYCRDELRRTWEHR